MENKTQSIDQPQHPSSLQEREVLTAPKEAVREHIACAQNEGWYVYRGTDERRGGFAELEAAIAKAESGR